MSTDPVDCPDQSAHYRPDVMGDLERADKTESLVQSRQERRLIGHQLTANVQDEAFALW